MRNPGSPSRSGVLGPRDRECAPTFRCDLHRVTFCVSFADMIRGRYRRNVILEEADGRLQALAGGRMQRAGQAAPAPSRLPTRPGDRHSVSQSLESQLRSIPRPDHVPSGSLTLRTTNGVADRERERARNAEERKARSLYTAILSGSGCFVDPCGRNWYVCP